MYTLNDLDKQLLIAGGIRLFLIPAVDAPAGQVWAVSGPFGGCFDEKRHSAVSEAFFSGISTGEGLGKGYYDSYRDI
ncbi:MAG: hypothetical protein IJ198_10145 [Lachnospiraceae bacterium]|nr:hypothetical protein [Lachnospiraceae bacterium]